MVDALPTQQTQTQTNQASTGQIDINPFGAAGKPIPVTTNPILEGSLARQGGGQGYSSKYGYEVSPSGQVTYIGRDAAAAAGISTGQIGDLIGKYGAEAAVNPMKFIEMERAAQARGQSQISRQVQSYSNIQTPTVQTTEAPQVNINPFGGQPIISQVPIGGEYIGIRNIATSQQPQQKIISPPPIRSLEQTYTPTKEEITPVMGLYPRTIITTDQSGKTVDVRKEVGFGLTQDPFYTRAEPSREVGALAGGLTGASIVKEISTKGRSVAKGESELTSTLADIAKTDIPIVSGVYQSAKGASKGSLEQAISPLPIAGSSFRAAQASTAGKPEIAGIRAIGAGAEVAMLSTGFKAGGKSTSFGLGEVSQEGRFGLVEAKALTRTQGIIGGGREFASDIKLKFEIPKSELEVSRGVSGITTQELKRTAPIFTQTERIIKAEPTRTIQFSKAVPIYKDSEITASVVGGLSYKLTPKGISKPTAFGAGVLSRETEGISVNVARTIERPSGQTGNVLLALRQKRTQPEPFLTGGTQRVTTPSPFVSQLAKAQTTTAIKTIEKELPKSVSIRPTTLMQPTIIKEQKTTERIEKVNIQIPKTKTISLSGIKERTAERQTNVPISGLSYETKQEPISISGNAMQSMLRQESEIAQQLKQRQELSQRTALDSGMTPEMIRMRFGIPSFGFTLPPQGTGFEERGRGRKIKPKTIRRYAPSLIGILSGRTMKRPPKETLGESIRLPVNVEGISTRRKK